MGHAGERALEWAVTEGGVGGVVGAILGAFLGWPQEKVTFVAGLKLSEYHNAFTHGTLKEVVEAGLLGAGVIAVVVGLVTTAVITASRSSNKTS